MHPSASSSGLPRSEREKAGKEEPVYPDKAEEVWGGSVSDDEREFGGLEVFGGAFREEVREKVLVHRSESNSSTFTFDGVDMMGERLANEVFSVVKNRGGGLKKISFVAHLLGGLVARYAVGKLYEQQLVIKAV
ncbi:hypothetical protein Bca52824_028411 [Brassica carinata]|uniref:DUF676 domain-containing protein n=1 Tax=Brassica carinata TaxID=52824 RepID=A0A8X8APY5_BRACI|nr:hypothetical protein Bca52824_028411 [Brassica carinata]